MRCNSGDKLQMLIWLAAAPKISGGAETAIVARIRVALSVKCRNIITPANKDAAMRQLPMSFPVRHTCAFGSQCSLHSGGSWA